MSERGIRTVRVSGKIAVQNIEIALCMIRRELNGERTPD